MATPEELRREQEANRLKQESNQAERIAINLAAQLAEQARGLTEEIKEQYGFRSRSTEQDRAVLNLSRQISKAAQENVRQIRQAGQLENELQKAGKLKLDTERELAIARKSVSQDDIATAKYIANLQKDRLDNLSRIDKLTEKLINASDEEAEGIRRSIKTRESVLENIEATLDSTLELASTEVKRLALAEQLNDQAEKNIQARERQLNIQEQINRATGIAGGLFAGLSTAFSKLGINFNPFDKVREAMNETAEKAAELRDIEVQKNFEKLVDAAKEAGDEIDNIKLEELRKQAEKTVKPVGRTKTLFAGIAEFGKQLKNTLFSVEGIVGSLVVFAQKVVRAFLELNAKAVEFGRLTGRNIELEAALNDQRITAVEYIEAAVAATNELGLSASAVFGPSQIAQIGEAVQLLGLSAEQATNLALRSEAVGMSLNSYQDGLLEGINAANKFTESAVAPGTALRDIADVSEDIALSLQNNPVLLGKAAVQARALGLSLKKVDDIAGGLLDFESSIEAELEAQLLTGRALNLSKAREFALMNDMEGVAREIANQGITAADFAGMNRLAQESLAQALGMSRQELAKTLQIQSMSAKEQEEANRLAMAQQSLQDRIRRAVNALQLAFAPIVEKILPYLVKFIDKAAGKVEQFVEKVLAGKGPLESLKEIFPTIGEKIDFLKGKLEDVKNIAIAIGATFLAYKVGTGIISFLTLIGSFGGGAAGAGIGGMLTGLGTGLAAIGAAAIPAAIGAAIVVGAITGIAFAISLLNPGQIAEFGEAIKSIFQGMAAIIVPVIGTIVGGIVELAKVIGGTIIKAIEATGNNLKMLLDSVTLEKVTNIGLLGPALSSLALGLGALTASDLIGSVVSGVKSLFGGDSPIEKLTKLSNLALPIQALSTAFERLGPAINSAMESVKVASFDNLSSDIVSTLTSRMNNLTTALGGYIDKYKKFAKLNKPEDLIEGVHELGTLVPTMNITTSALNSMAAAVMSLATALKAITTDDIRKIQDLVEAGFESDTRSTFEIIAEPVNKLAKVLGGGEEGDAADIVAKLDELIKVVRDGGNVYMDMRDVGETGQLRYGSFS
jgi:hypothetical protein